MNLRYFWKIFGVLFTTYLYYTPNSTVLIHWPVVCKNWQNHFAEIWPGRTPPLTKPTWLMLRSWQFIFADHYRSGQITQLVNLLLQWSSNFWARFFDCWTNLLLYGSKRLKISVSFIYIWNLKKVASNLKFVVSVFHFCNYLLLAFLLRKRGTFRGTWKAF